jgi:hypothetical protein
MGLIKALNQVQTLFQANDFVFGFERLVHAVDLFLIVTHPWVDE